MSIISKIKNLLGDHQIEDEIVILNQITPEEEAAHPISHLSDAKVPVMGNKEYQQISDINDIVSQMKK